jgi:hypothetical protein
MEMQLARNAGAAAAARDEMLLRMQMNDRELASRERIAGLELGSRDRLATMDLEARRQDAEMNRSFQERMQNAGFANQNYLANLQLDAQTRTNLMQMEQNSFNQWAAGLNNIMINTQMSAEDRSRAQANWTAMFAPNPYFPYRPATSAYTPAPPAPPAPSAPPPPAPTPYSLITGGRP